MSIDNRLLRIERRLGLGNDDEIVGLPLDDGPTVRMTRREWDRVLDEVMAGSTRLLPKEIEHGWIVATNQGS